MRSSAFLVLTAALLAATDDYHQRDWYSGIHISKCCDVEHMLSADGTLCVETNWPGNFSVTRDESYFIVPPLDSAWVARWLPPGLPLLNISTVFDGRFSTRGFLSSLNASSFWDPDRTEKNDFSSNTITFLPSSPGELGCYPQLRVAVSKPGGGFREADYCVDAAWPPLGPFAVRFQTQCSGAECANTCCSGPRRLKGIGQVGCERDEEGGWSPHTSTLAVFDPEFPSQGLTQLCMYPRLLPFDERYIEWSRHSHGVHHFRFSTWNTCFDFYRSGNGSLQEGLFYCEYSRITRGVYWLLRPLCFLSALLLLASLLSVACDKNMRRKMHGRCLACHAACLLVFNVGQIWYYIAASDRMDEEGKHDIPKDLRTVCKYFALSMYFVLTAAWFWLTALCANMARGFRLHVPRFDKGSEKKFMAISAFAWGLPAVLTITCAILFTQPEGEKTPAWYIPSLMETRMCYIESLTYQLGFFGDTPFVKSGTALFYYGPVCCLVICNITCLVLTLRKVQYLKRGNSVLHREEDQILLHQIHTEGNNPPTAHTATDKGQIPQGRNRRGTAVDAKTIKLYIKLILISGSIELLTEIVMWFTTKNNLRNIREKFTTIEYSRKDRDLAYRAAGYVTDFFRAAVVTWLAAPEGGYLGLIMGMLRRGKSEKKSAGAGNAGRRKQNVA